MPLSLKGAAKMANTWTTLLDAVYPIGSVYSAYTSTSPATRFGGTWSAITGKFPYYNAGTGTGGGNTHTLTVAQMPKHRHIFSISGNAQAVVNTLANPHAAVWDSNAGGLAIGEMQYEGGGAAHNNMPAYQTLYAWRRTA